MALTDSRGTVHEVTVTEESHDYWSACGWSDRVAYDPSNPRAEAMTRDFADLRLRERASAHVPSA